MADVHMLPYRARAGRPRRRPLPDVPLADVIGFKSPFEAKELTPEQKIAELNRAIDRIVLSVLEAVRTVQSLDQTSRSRSR